LCLVPSTLGGAPPLGERGLTIGFEPFSGSESGFETRWRQRGKNGARNGGVDLHSAHAQTKDAAAIDNAFAGAMVAWRGGASGVVGAQFSPACTAGGGTVNLSGRVSHIQVDGKMSQGSLLPNAADFRPDVESLGPGSSVLSGSDMITAEVEQVIDLIVGGEEALRLAGRFKLLHLPLSSACRLV
jgi:hypothetical protein